MELWRVRLPPLVQIFIKMHKYKRDIQKQKLAAIAKGGRLSFKVNPDCHDYNESVSLYSENPSEILNLMSTVQPFLAEHEINPVEVAISRHICRMKDNHFIELAGVAFYRECRRHFLSKNGIGLDQVALQCSGEGIEVTEEDIIDFIKKYAVSGMKGYRTQPNKLWHDLKKRFIEVTGHNPSKIVFETKPLKITNTPF